MSTASQGYTTTAKVLHWLIVALLVVQFIIAWTMPHIGHETRPETLINLHFTTGAVILCVAIFRLCWRVTHPEPRPEAGVPPWQRLTARVVHWLLYLLLFVIPLLGWLNASWRGFPIVMFGLELPALLQKRSPSWSWTGDVHSLLANYVLLGLVGLHVLAALYHRLVLHDRVMQRMLP